MCRLASGTGWSAPAAIKVEGGSFGFSDRRLGDGCRDAVMNAGGVENYFRASSHSARCVRGSRHGGPHSSANTDLQMNAQILSYSAHEAFLPVSRWTAPHSGPMTTQCLICMERRK